MEYRLTPELIEFHENLKLKIRLSRLHHEIKALVLAEADGLKSVERRRASLERYLAWCRSQGISEKEIRREFHHGRTHAGAILGVRGGVK